MIKKKGDLTGSGKGDTRRSSVTNKKWQDNYDKIFPKKIKIKIKD
jgi:hypothetical protein